MSRLGRVFDKNVRQLNHAGRRDKGMIVGAPKALAGHTRYGLYD
jgi:hypothetical protein